MKSKKGIDIVTSVGTRLYDAFVNASTSGMKRVVTTVGTGAGLNQMAMQNDTTIVDVISASGMGLPTEKAVADVLCKTVWTGSLALIGTISNTRFVNTSPITQSKDYYYMVSVKGSLAKSSTASVTHSIEFVALLKPSVHTAYDDVQTTLVAAQRLSPNISLIANVIMSDDIEIYCRGVNELYPYVKSMTVTRIDTLAKPI